MKKLFLILFLMFLYSISYSEIFVQTTKVDYSTTTGKAIFTRVDTFQIGISTQTVYVILRGSGTVEAIDGRFTNLFGDGTGITGIVAVDGDCRISTNPLVYQSYNSTMFRNEFSTDVYTNGYSSATTFYGDGSNLTGIEAGGAGGIAGEVINFYIPGDAYITTGIAYFGPLSYQITLASAMATVTADGTYPRGTGDLNFDIQISSGIPQSPFETIMNSTYSLQIASGTCWTETTDFRDPVLKANYVIRLDIGEICGTFPGGDPICVTLYGKQE